MKARLLSLWESLRTNYWFIPSVMAIGAMLLAFLTTRWDARLSENEVRKLPWVWIGSPDGARQVLAAIAGSMITVAGVTFSITIVALAQASTQFGPRLLRNFMRDAMNQMVLGTFVATFIYCLLVMRTVHDGAAGTFFVPHLSVTCGIGLALASLALLIYFIHHVCDALQAENLVAHVGHELEHAIKTELPELDGSESDSPPENSPEFKARHSLAVPAVKSGYVEVIDAEGLFKLACGHDAQFVLARHAGDFVGECNTLVTIRSLEPVPEEVIDQIREAFILGRHRTPTQDLDYAVHQMVEIAVRALSPGVNDPFTAMTCVDWLGSALNLMAGRKIPSGEWCDGDGVLRVKVEMPSFRRMADAAFNQIRQNARHNVAVSIRLLETLAHIARRAHRPADREIIAEHACRVVSDCQRGVENEWDLGQIQELGQTVLSLTAAGASNPPESPGRARRGAG